MFGLSSCKLITCKSQLAALCSKASAFQLLNFVRSISTSSRCSLREIHIKTDKDLTIVEGAYVPSERTDKVLKIETKKDFCPLCPNKLGAEIKYTDVLILSQFLRADGCVLPRTVTGLCHKAQTNLQRKVHQAQRAGLLPEFRPDLWTGEPRTGLKSRHKWRKYNIYFDE
jgi:ribosomal protein S18